jgi:hypothetical protein
MYSSRNLKSKSTSTSTSNDLLKDEDRVHVPNNKELFEMIKEMKITMEKMKNEIEMWKSKSKRYRTKEIVDLLQSQKNIPSKTFTCCIREFQLPIDILKNIHEIGIEEGFKKYIEFNHGRIMTNETETDILSPICSFIQKPNTLYIFDEDEENQENKWQLFQEKHMISLITNTWMIFLELYSKNAVNEHILTTEIQDLRMKMIANSYSELNKHKTRLIKWLCSHFQQSLDTITMED